ncbi:MAG: hypothetical protein Q9210_006354 [Variospora velana]
MYSIPYQTFGLVSLLTLPIAYFALGLPRCWYPQISPNPLIFKECNYIITKLIPRTGNFDTSIPLIFSRDESLHPDVETPKSWQLPRPVNCIVGIDIAHAVGGSDKTSLKDIQHAATAIAIECVIKPPHLGGILQIGWQEKLNVIITGLEGPKGMLRHGPPVNRTTGEVLEIA